MNTNAPQPLFCKNTGSYGASIAAFCAAPQFPESPLRLTKPQPPLDLDQKSWPLTLNQSQQLQPHSQTKIYRNARSILNRKQSKVTLLINPVYSTFIELPHNQSEPWHNLDNIQKIGLIRHHLLAPATDTILGEDQHTGLFFFEGGLKFGLNETGTVIQNLWNGRQFLCSPDWAKRTSHQVFAVSPQDQNLTSYCLKLCKAGLLRQVSSESEA